MGSKTGSKSEQFWAAMDKEIKGLVKRSTWSVVPTSKPLATGNEVVSGTWAFRKKRPPDGTFRKHKARFCVRGDLQKISNKKMQEAMDASEVLTEKEIKESLDTHSPVVSWVTVRLMMIFGLLLSLQSKSIDFSNAFVQAELESPVFLEIPQGYESKETGDMVLELHRSLYGQIEAPKLWYEKLKNGMEARNFKTSELDPCLFISKKMVCASCVDDCLCWFKDDKTFNKLTKTFKDCGDEFNWEMTVEQDVTAFLGI